MKTYTVPVFYTVGGFLEIHAKDKEEAAKKAQRVQTESVWDKGYVDDTWHVANNDIEED